LLPNQLKKDTTKAPKRADINPETEKPSTKVATNQNINPLITRVNNPKVRILIGKVSTIKIGFKNRFKIPKTTATIKAIYILLTTIPGIR
jgi:hypothetical protein